jgi:hypothetical protein
MSHHSAFSALPFKGVVGLGMFLILAGACTFLESKEEVAREARVVVTGTAPVPLELVTSTKFTRTIEETGEVTISLAFADTAFINLATPHDQVYPVRPDRGFLVRLRNPGTEAALVSVQVFFDGRLNYDRQNVALQDASLEFSYIFEGKVPH